MNPSTYIPTLNALVHFNSLTSIAVTGGTKTPIIVDLTLPPGSHPEVAQGMTIQAVIARSRLYSTLTAIAVNKLDSNNDIIMSVTLKCLELAVLPGDNQPIVMVGSLTDIHKTYTHNNSQDDMPNTAELDTRSNLQSA